MAVVLVGAATGCLVEEQRRGPVAGKIEAQDTGVVVGTCGPFGQFQPASGVVLEPVPGPTFTRPSSLAKAPGDPLSWYVGEPGSSKLWRFVPGSTEAHLVADFSAKGSLLGFAFHPGFETNHQLFVYLFSLDPGVAYVSAVYRVTVLPGLEVADVEGAELLVRHTQPEPFHNGGHLAFGLDGQLLIGTGEGGGAVPSERPLDPFSFAGKVLRVDVDHPDPVRDTPYSIPADNPFADGADGAPEVFALGFRNPWRFSVDRVTGDVWLGDVGDEAWEEVNVVRPGRSYGWPRMEGFECHRGQACDPSPFEPPVFTYGREASEAVRGASITGGVVYRGEALPALGGRYLFADWWSGIIGALLAGDDRPASAERLLSSGLQVVALAEDEGGEVTLLDYAGGGLHRLRPSAEVAVTSVGGPPPPPLWLSQTQCMTRDDVGQPGPALVPYDVAVPLFSDGADKERFIALPPGRRLSVRDDGTWEFPPGTTFVKTFSKAGRRLETRFLLRHEDGQWAGYTWVWQASQLDASLVRTGTRIDDEAVGSWQVPSESECLACHSERAGVVLGFRPAELGAEQLEALSGLFETKPLPAAPLLSVAPEASLEWQARSALDANCAHCHRGPGPGRAIMDLRASTPFADMGLCDAPPRASPSLADAVLVKPGAPGESLLLARMRSTSGDRMPPLGNRLVDERSVALVEAWVSSLGACPE
ncbi:MAG: PQQ-dependent sugar dehydrogenase [Myxococcaceae bacterium]|nr:PQQ-dependent sugar dehydrogenase [Myxococcaceae bacterium]MCA3014493.1 PQQ-dependent sugar dehydrogenase [Myxococcaceae bacterium]